MQGTSVNILYIWKLQLSVKVIQFTGEMKLSGTGLPQVSEPGLIQ